MAAYFHQPSRGLRAEERRNGGTEKRRNRETEERLGSCASSLHCTVGPTRGHLTVLTIQGQAERGAANARNQRRKRQNTGRVCFLPRERQRPLWHHVLALDVLCVSRPEEPMGSQAPEAMLLLSGDRGLPHRGKKLLHRLSRQRHGLHPRICHGMSRL